jgi:GNAT superfamily N-acetyltransferase
MEPHHLVGVQYIAATCEGEGMSWDDPDRWWEFAMGDDPPGDFPDAWATAARAVTRDLDCRQYGQPMSFTGMKWSFKVSDRAIAVGFAGPAGTYNRCLGYLLETSTSQALVWLADDVQYELTGYLWVQWPIAGQRILAPRLVDGHAVWVEPSTGAHVAAIGELCSAVADRWRAAHVRPMTADDAAVVAGWRYPGKWSVYDLADSQRVLDNLADYRAVASGDDLLGFVCTGVEARVPVMAEGAMVLDVGIGMDPELTGQGDGFRFAQVVIRYLTVQHPGVTLRAVIQAWNERSLRLARRLGFRETGELTVQQGGGSVEYRIVEMPVGQPN